VPGLVNYLLSLAVRLAPRSMVVKESMKYFRPRKKKDDDKDESLPEA